jgi:hypothetical protein
MVNDYKDSPICPSPSGFEEKLAKVEMSKTILGCIAVSFWILGYLPRRLLKSTPPTQGSLGRAVSNVVKDMLRVFLSAGKNSQA